MYTIASVKSLQYNHSKEQFIMTTDSRTWLKQSDSHITLSPLNLYQAQEKL